LISLKEDLLALPAGLGEALKPRYSEMTVTFPPVYLLFGFGHKASVEM
jgi:hypothetical protein